MKRTFLFAVLAASLTCAKAQQAEAPQAPDRANHLSFGFHLNNFQNDFGYGVSLTSPYFFERSMAIHLAANMAYHEGVVKPDSDTQWYPYVSVQLGTIGVGGMIGKQIRTYGTGGVIVLLPTTDFSTTKTEIGGYGAWGFEFILNPYISYYFELGGVGIGAKADKMVGQPLYSNGFSTKVGLKVYL